MGKSIENLVRLGKDILGGAVIPGVIAHNAGRGLLASSRTYDIKSGERDSYSGNSFRDRLKDKMVYGSVAGTLGIADFLSYAFLYGLVLEEAVGINVLGMTGELFKDPNYMAAGTALSFGALGRGLVNNTFASFRREKETELAECIEERRKSMSQDFSGR